MSEEAKAKIVKDEQVKQEFVETHELESKSVKNDDNKEEDSVKYAEATDKTNLVEMKVKEEKDAWACNSEKWQTTVKPK